MFPTGENRGAEGSVRLYLQGLCGAEDEQEAGKDPGGTVPHFDEIPPALWEMVSLMRSEESISV